ncbi:hypothetical protein CDL12_28755 [Handroanthus impetiginosus]|uniref:Uncharacterized protein n=1 Tax=Handroanthus impetiginosus TaxID=429701 RepID=A0A2G9G0D0_9LAMI|nr:hypothetical protein CDL12_28755 [Handroanthus impetiginosus]
MWRKCRSSCIWATDNYSSIERLSRRAYILRKMNVANCSQVPIQFGSTGNSLEAISRNGCNDEHNSNPSESETKQYLTCLGNLHRFDNLSVGSNISTEIIYIPNVSTYFSEVQ